MSPSSNVVKLAVLVACASFSLYSTVAAFAWESDVHYGLTRWLAIKAGFSPADAEIIARGDQGEDEGTYEPATWAVGVHVLTNGDIGAAKSVQRWHFPSYGPVPSEPYERAVYHNSPAAREEAEKTIKFQGEDKPFPRRLEDFGRALHPLQDSWSHEGEPDIPFRPVWRRYPRLSWGHPITRGGWYAHDADITCLHEEDNYQMANETYRQLTAYLKEHPDQRNSTETPWSVLSAKVRAFARSCTKQAKLAWFNADQDVPFSRYGNQTFLQCINTPGHFAQALNVTCGWLPAKPYLPLIAGQSEKAPEDLEGAVREFLVAWLEQHDIEHALKFVSVNRLRTEFRELARDRTRPRAVAYAQHPAEIRLTQSAAIPQKEDDAVQLWLERFLTLWLIEDHGLVNQMGHGLPGAEGYKLLPSDPKLATEGFRIRPAKPLRDQIESPGTVGGYYLSKIEWEDLKPEGAYMLSFHFRDMPYDSLLVLFVQEADGWRVARIFWAIQ